MATYQDIVAQAAKQGISADKVAAKAKELGMVVSGDNLQWQSPEARKSALQQTYGTTAAKSVSADKATGQSAYDPTTNTQRAVNPGESINAKGEIVAKKQGSTPIELSITENVDTSGIYDAFSNIEGGRQAAGAISNWLKSNYGAIGKDLQSMAKRMGDTEGKFESALKTSMFKLDQQKAVNDLKNKSMEDAFGILEGEQANKYADIMARINSQESLLDNKFNEMRQNFEVIKQGYQLGQEAGEQASSVATSRQLRGIGGGAGQAISSGLSQARGRTAMLNMAQLNTKLAEASNALEQNYLTLKDKVMQDKNLSDTQRSQVIDALNNKFNAINEIKAADENKYTEDKFALPTKMQEAELSNMINQNINAANAKRTNTDPAMREQQIQQVLGTALTSRVNIPSSIMEQARNAPTSTDMLNIVYNYINNSVPKSSQNSAAMSTMIKMLAAQKAAGGNTEASGNSAVQ